jgi:hypothetical protein
MRNITIVGLFTVLLAASFSAGSPDRAAALNAEVGGMGMLQDDTPITISDGSPLTIESVRPFVEYDDNEIFPDHVHRTVTEVGISVDGKALGPFAFNNERCQVDITYGKTTLAVRTNRFGQVLRVRTSPGTFLHGWVPSKDKKTYTIDTPGAYITSVQVAKAGKTWRFPKLPPGRKVITIHYRNEPVVKQ